MAFAKNALRVEFATGSYGPSTATKYFREASYITPDLPAVVETAGYFNDAASRMPVGTVLAVVMGIGGTVDFKAYVVSVNDGTNVTIKPQAGATAATGVNTVVVTVAPELSQYDIGIGERPYRPQPGRNRTR